MIILPVNEALEDSSEWPNRGGRYRPKNAAAAERSFCPPCLLAASRTGLNFCVLDFVLCHQPQLAGRMELRVDFALEVSVGRGAL